MATTRTLPGFRPALGFTVLYLCLIVLIPLAGVVLRSASLSWPQYWQTISSPRAVASYRLTLGASGMAAVINGVFGMLVAWVLVRYQFPGRRLLDALIDLPLALPTAVAGIALTALYAPTGWIGGWLAPAGWNVAFTPLGIVVALTFVSLPFVVRTVQPVLQDLDSDVEEAAASLGATPGPTFRRIVLPTVLPALVTGTALAFARAIGEYGSIVFISGNLPLKTEVTTLLIMTKLEQYDYGGATALATVMLALSFTILLTINLCQAWLRRRNGALEEAH
jgi:sulfate transport system permease protein